MCFVAELWQTLGEKVFGLFCTLFAVFFGSLTFIRTQVWTQQSLFPKLPLMV